jgi:NAD-dependent SIR2 family protein deacetylase
VDGLYQKTKIDPQKIVEFHGSVKNKDIILFDHGISEDIIRMVKKDFIECINDDNNKVDMVIVMGKALQVAPFCSLPNFGR